MKIHASRHYFKPLKKLQHRSPSQNPGDYCLSQLPFEFDLENQRRLRLLDLAQSKNLGNRNLSVPKKAKPHRKLGTLKTLKVMPEISPKFLIESNPRDRTASARNLPSLKSQKSPGKRSRSSQFSTVPSMLPEFSMAIARGEERVRQMEEQYKLKDNLLRSLTMEKKVECDLLVS